MEHSHGEITSSKISKFLQREVNLAFCLASVLEISRAVFSWMLWKLPELFWRFPEPPHSFYLTLRAKNMVAFCTVVPTGLNYWSPLSGNGYYKHWDEIKPAGPVTTPSHRNTGGAPISQTSWQCHNIVPTEMLEETQLAINECSKINQNQESRIPPELLRE